ncbi:unnamed protein product [Sphagnum tenellum]
MQQSDEFDLDALLQAQSSDDDDDDGLLLPDFERSLEDILNDVDSAEGEEEQEEQKKEKEKEKDDDEDENNNHDAGHDVARVKEEEKEVSSRVWDRVANGGIPRGVSASFSSVALGWGGSGSGGGASIIRPSPRPGAALAWAAAASRQSTRSAASSSLRKTLSSASSSLSDGLNTTATAAPVTPVVEKDGDVDREQEEDAEKEKKNIGEDNLTQPRDAINSLQEEEEEEQQQQQAVTSFIGFGEVVGDPINEDHSSLQQLESLIGTVDDSESLNSDNASDEVSSSAAAEEPVWMEEHHERASQSAKDSGYRDTDDEYMHPGLDPSSRVAEDLRTRNRESEAVVGLQELSGNGGTETTKSRWQEEEKQVQNLTALDLAEEQEKRTASSGLHWEEGVAARPMQLEGIQRGPPAIGLLQLDSAGSLSHALASPAMRRDHGSPEALAVHTNLIAVGLSKGALLVTPSKYSATCSTDEMEPSKAFFLGGSIDKVGPAVSAICFNQQGDLLLAGYTNGTVSLWDLTRRTVAKTISGEHSAAIVHTLFLGQESGAGRHLRAITGDCRGLVLLHTFTVVPFVRRFSVTTQCLLDGQHTGTVLSVSPLLPDDGFQVMGMASTAQQVAPASSVTLGSVIGGVGGGAMDVGRKFLYDGPNFADDGAGGMVVFVTHTTVLVVRLVPSLDVCARLTRPAGIREGAIPYTAWRRIRAQVGTFNTSLLASDGADEDNWPVLALAWDKKMLIAQLLKSELRIVGQWDLDSPAVGVVWLEEQMMVVATAKDQLCLFTKEGVEVERASLGGEQEGLGAIIYHTHILNTFGNPEKTYHSSLSVRGAALYILGTLQLWRARLLPWGDRIKALQDAGDWMGAFHIAMELYDGQARGVTGLPRGLDAMREAIMETLLALLSAYIDEAFAYLSLVIPSSPMPPVDVAGTKDHLQAEEAVPTVADSWGGGSVGQDMIAEAREQYARVGGVAIEFCVHVGKREVLFENVFHKFEAVSQRGTFLELLEPYILKDMLGALPPEVMQALVEHYSQRGWLERVEQCVLHMDIASLDFNQVVKLCREHGLYNALIYLFTKGLDDFTSPMEELLAVAQHTHNPSHAQAIGYKLLVYLKHCFCGLSFPPGHGSLPAKRLPALRGEILRFLLDQHGMQREQSSEVSNGADRSKYPRLLYLLQLDTPATLLVLRLAFPVGGPLDVGKQGYGYITRPNNEQMSEEATEVATTEIVDEGRRFLQAIVSAFIEILDLDNRSGAGSSEDSQEIWPSRGNIESLLEFVAQYVASRHAVVSRGTLMHILEYLVSFSSESRKARENEDLMVALLNSVPDSDFDASHTLHLAQEACFWQVCALLYTHDGEYISALDSYLKDANCLHQPFTFIMQMLDHINGLKGSVLTDFREAVLTRMPQLMQHNIKGTLWIVLEHLSGENQRVMKELGSHSQLLFAYLKAIMDARSSSRPLSSIGSKPVVVASSSSHSVTFEEKDSSASEQLETGGVPSIFIPSQWEPDIHVGDLLQRSGMEFTDEMAELYVQLLCQFEPRLVLKFLESYENYRLEHCLKLCQEYGITDAAIFLLERVGDVASALGLLLVEVDARMLDFKSAIMASSSLAAQVSNNNDKWLDIPQVASFKSALAAAVTLCQRNTLRLDQQESESLWFRVLDRFDLLLSVILLQIWVRYEVDHMLFCHLKIILAAGNCVRRVLVWMMGDVIDGMMGYVPLRVIMDKILAEHGNHPFGDFRATILNMLSAYGYERAILRTAKQLIEDDTFYNVGALRRGYAHAYAPITSTCCICGLKLDDMAMDALHIYYCGHAAHTACMDTAGNLKDEDRGLTGCPVCTLKKKPNGVFSHGKEAAWQGDRVPKVGTPSSPVPDVTVPSLQGAGSTTRSNHALSSSRLELLKQLHKGKGLPTVGSSLQLCLAPPPRVRRDHVASVPSSSTTIHGRSRHRTLLAVRK